MSLHIMTHWWLNNYLQFPWIDAFFYDVYIKNDVMMCSKHNTFSSYFFLNIHFIYPATIQGINEDYLLKIGEVMTFCNGHIYYGSSCTKSRIWYSPPPRYKTQFVVSTSFMTKRRRSDPVLWQKPLHQQKCQMGKVTTQTTLQKSLIKQQLRTDLGRSVGVTTTMNIKSC